MLIKGYIIVFIKIYIYFRVIYLFKNCHRVCFSMKKVMFIMNLQGYIENRVILKRSDYVY